MYKIKVIIKNKVLSIFHANMYVSSCQSVDMRIDIVKYEEGAFKRRNWKKIYSSADQNTFAFTGFY